MTKDLITQAAQKEAEGLYPDDVIWYEEDNSCMDGVTPPTTRRSQPSKEVSIQRAAHVKCALLYSERAAGLVEAGNELHGKLFEWCGDDQASILAEETHNAMDKWDAALRAFNSQT